jgi:hypothetical protein
MTRQPSEVVVFQEIHCESSFCDLAHSCYLSLVILRNGLDNITQSQAWELAQAEHIERAIKT